jgi:flavin reductase (DIM6/NTAB) family NADH-FMN oxidoreductase RutF
VAAPRVAEAAVQMECVLDHIHEDQSTGLVRSQ